MPGGRTTAQGGCRAQCSMVDRMGLENGSPDCLPCRVPRHLPFLQLSPGQGRGWHPRYALILSTVLGSGAGRSGPRGALLEGSVSLPYSGSGSGCGDGFHGGRWLRLMSRKEAGTAGTTR